MAIFRRFLFAATLTLAAAPAALAATYTVHQTGTNSGLDWNSVSGAFTQAIAASGDQTIQITDNNGGSGYTEPRMDLPISPLGNITITALVPVTITASGSNEIFRNRSSITPEKSISIIGLSAASPITLFSNNASALVGCETPSTLVRNGLIHLENVVLQKGTSTGNTRFLRIDSRATGQQYLKNVTFIGGQASNTFELMRAGSDDPNSAQKLYMEFVSFSQASGSAQMMLILNRATIEAKNCIFRPLSGSNMNCIKASSSNSGNGAIGGSNVTLRDCQFQSKNGGTGTPDAFILLGETFQTTPNVYKIYRPQFFDCGANTFNLDDRPCEVYLLGLDDNDQPTVPKIDLNTIPSTTFRYAMLRGNNKISLTRCSANDDLGSSLKSIGPLGSLVGNPVIELNHCDFKGTAIIAFSDSGTGAPIINMTNCIYRADSSFIYPFITTSGSNAGVAQVTLSQCTFTANSSVFFTANARDKYYGPGTIFDGTLSTSIAAFDLQPSAVPSIAWTSLGTSGFTSVPGNTIVADPHLSSSGHLTSASTVAFNAATGSTFTTDIDDDARPLPVGATASDIGADETFFAVTDITLAAGPVADDTANGTSVGTFTAVDPDQDTSFVLTNDGGGAFSLSGNTLQVADYTVLDGFATPSVGVTVKGTDLGGASVTKSFPITISHTNASVASVAVQDMSTVRVTFTRAVGASALNAANYTLSGTGQGTFAATPDAVSAHSATEYDLTWNAPAEMTTGGDMTITVSNAILDLKSAPIAAPLSATHTGGGLGTAPTLSSITAPSLTNLDDFDFTVTFSEAVQNVDTSSFVVTPTDATFTGYVVNGGPSVYTVTVQGAAGDGTIAVALSNTNTITDLGGNALTPSALSASVTLDNTAPAITAITATDTSPTNAPHVHFTVTFSEPVTGFGLSSGTLTATAGTLNGASILNTTPATGDTYTVTADRGTGDLSFRLDVAANPAITDAAGNALDTAFTTGGIYVIHELRLTQDLPATGSIAVGGSNHFLITATGGLPAYNYAWYYSAQPGGPFTPIPSAFSNSYELTTAAVTDTGYYYATVSDPNQTVNSTTEFLSVATGVPAVGLAGLALLALGLTAAAARTRKS